MKKILAMLLTGVMIIGTLSGCGDGTTEVATAGDSNVSAQATDNASDEGTAAGADTQVLNLRTTAFGNNYDVQDMGWRWMMGDCYEGLYRNVADEDGEHFILAGADSVDVSDDGLVYTFHLRQNAKWSDGQPVTAHDYEYGWKRLLDSSKGYDYASFALNVVGAEEYNKGTGSRDDVAAKALDDYTFEVTLKVADPTFDAKLVATPLYPTREDIAEAAGDNWGKDWTLCVYNGPFCMSELVEDNKMVWTKNPYYWDADNTKLDTVNWFLVAEDSTAATMFENGELDVLQTSGDYATKYSAAAAEGKYVELTSDYPGTVTMNFEFRDGGLSGLMKNVKIRKAISYCIDRDEMVEAIYGRYKPAYGYVAPAITFDGEPWRNQVEEPAKAEYEQYGGDPAKLQALFQEGLDELGVTTPISDITLNLLTSGNTIENQSEREYIQQVISQKLGCKVELNSVGDFALFKAQRDDNQYDMMIGGWWSDYNDPLDYLNTFHTGYYDSYGYYSNPEYDALADSLVGENDMAKRKEIYTQMENMLFDDCALAPIYYNTKQVFLQNWVKDFRTSSFGASQELYITRIEGRNR